MKSISGQGNIPTHVAIIMDGNGRWAHKKGLPRTAGHHEGAKRIKEIVRCADELGIKVVTFFAFSHENWSRPRREIDVLMRLMNNFLDKQIRELCRHNIKFRVIGRRKPIPDSVYRKVIEAQEKTKDNTGIVVVFALNYGARQEIVDAAKRIAERAVCRDIQPEDIDEEMMRQHFYAGDLPDPDLLIRTSGEMRLSNFLLWQLSYAELYFFEKYWPDFTKDDFEKAIKIYEKRQRRFGGVEEAPPAQELLS